MMTSPSETPNQGPAPLAEFWHYVTDFTSVYGNLSKLALGAPFIDLVLNLGSPWPSRVTVSTAGLFLLLGILMCSFEFWQQSTQSRQRIKTRMLQAFVVFIVLFLVLYMPLFAMFIENNQDAWNRVIIGYKYLGPIQKLVDSDPVKWSPKTLLLHFTDAETDETGIWTPESVKIMRAIMTISWLVVWSAYGVVVSAFVALQYRRLGETRRSASRRPKSTNTEGGNAEPSDEGGGAS